MVKLRPFSDGWWDEIFRKYAQAESNQNTGSTGSAGNTTSPTPDPVVPVPTPVIPQEDLIQTEICLDGSGKVTAPLKKDQLVLDDDQLYIANDTVATGTVSQLERQCGSQALT